MDRKDVVPRSLQYLVAIGEHGSFTRAAEALNVSQPTLSQQIKQLEDLLQAQLVDRSGRNVRLTDAGEVYMRHVHRALGEIRAGTRAIHDVQNLTRGTLRLGWTPVTDCLTRSLLSRLHRKYPRITLTALELPQNDIEAAVADSHIDVGIAFSTPTSIERSSGNIATLTLFEDTLCLAVGARHPLANDQSSVELETFAEVPLALLKTDFALRRRVDKYLRDHGISPRIAIESNSLSVIVEMVRLGDLATILPRTLVATCQGFHALTMKPALPKHQVSLIWHKGGYVSAACGAFIHMASGWAADMAVRANGGDCPALPQRLQAQKGVHRVSEESVG